MNKSRKRKSRLLFPIALLTYALLFLAATAAGMHYLWDYLDAFERSRPQTTLDSYMAQLNKDYVADRCGQLMATIDPNVQSPEQCREVILASLDGRFTCAKKAKESDENTHVYALRCGKQVIGSVIMTRTGETLGSFTAWEIADEAFDLSHLVNDPISVTVPEDYTVYSLGNKLDSGYITESGIPYPILAEYYEEYDLPAMVTYTAGPYLGEGALTVTDPAGNAVTMDPDMDMNVFANNCSQAEIDAVKAASEGFVQSYVDFTSCTGNDTMGNYGRLKTRMVSGGELAKRMYEAIVGLYWVTDRHASITGLDIHNYVNLENDRYLCCLTYTVDTTDFAGATQATSSIKLVLLQTTDGLKVESMISY